MESIVCIGNPTWEGNYQKTIVQILSELAPRYRILYVDYQHTVKDAFRQVTGRKARSFSILQSLGWKNPIREYRLENGGLVHVLTPPLMLPINKLPDSLYDFALRLESYRLALRIRSAMQAIGMERPIVLNAFKPTFGYTLLGQLNERATLYYCYDEIATSAWIREQGVRYEQLFMPRVDAIVTTSETLRISKGAHNPEVYAVKNGGNFALFHQAMDLMPQTDRSRPTVGYLGTVDNRLDLDLIEASARALPDVQFEFLGRVSDEAIVQRFAALPNVTFLPPVAPADIPAWLAGVHVGVIPFARNEHTYTIYPLKINEYLAAGLPVVSTGFSILDDFAGVIRIANEPAAFIQALQEAFSDTSEAAVAKRLACAAGNSWGHRADELARVIEQTLARKEGRTKAAVTA